MKTARYLLLSFAASALLLAGCNDKNKDTKEDFKKEEILSNLADNYAIPGYADLQSSVTALSDAWSSFVAAPDADALNGVRNSWLSANISFQKVKMFDLGPAMTVGLNASFGTFPADTAQIENNISSGTYNLLTADNIDAAGFDALEYLLFGNDALNQLNASAQRCTYISDVISKMSGEINQVVSGWNSYRSTFIAGTGTSSTSAFSMLVNAFCRDFELSKTAKIGIPVGMQSLGIQQPHYLEARRSGYGKELLAESIRSLHAVFRGKSLSGTEGKGFDDYLTALEKSTLSSTIDSRFSSMAAEPGSWNGTIENLMNSTPSTLTNFYNYMQGSVVYLKTDMASAFGVLITYQDNDGD